MIAISKYRPRRRVATNCSNPSIPKITNLTLAGLHCCISLFQFFVLPIYLLPKSPRWGFVLVPLALTTTPLWALLHEAIHDVFNASRRVNRGAGRLLAISFGSPFHVLRLTHLSHHKFNRASTEKAVKGTRGTMFPTLSLVGQVNTNYSTVPAQVLQSTTTGPTSSFVTVGGTQYTVYSPQDQTKEEKISFGNQFNNNLFTFVGINLNIPIFNGLKLRTNYKLAQVARDQAVFNEKTTLVQLRQSVESYYVTMMSNYRIYNTLQDQVSNYEQSYKAAGIKYDAGAMKSVDFIIYKTNIDRARLNFIQAKYNYILQTKILDYFQGKLTW